MKNYAVHKVLTLKRVFCFPCIEQKIEFFYESKTIKKS